MSRSHAWKAGLLAVLTSLAVAGPAQAVTLAEAGPAKATKNGLECKVWVDLEAMTNWENWLGLGSYTCYRVGGSTNKITTSIRTVMERKSTATVPGGTVSLYPALTVTWPNSPTDVLLDTPEYLPRCGFEYRAYARMTFSDKTFIQATTAWRKRC